MNAFRKFAEKSNGKKVLILCHRQADVDAIASAALMQKLLAKSKTTIGIPHSLNSSAKALAKNLKISYQINPEISGFDALLMVDFNSPEMLGSEALFVEKSKIPFFIIDHHSNSKEFSASAKNSIINPKAVSTTQIIRSLFKALRVKISKKDALLFSAGIIADSCNFSNANSETFSTLSELLKISGSNVGQIASLFGTLQDVSERIASLKAAERLRLFKAGNFLIALSTVSCFENLAADSLVGLGADIAFVGFSDEKRELRINARALQEFVQKTGFSLPKNVFFRLEEFFEGSGGGHDAAAGFNGTAESAVPLLEKCVQLSFEFLKSKGLAEEIKELK